MPAILLRKLILFTAMLTTLLFSFPASATGSAVSYHGRIMMPDGTTPVTDAAVQFKMQVLTPDGHTCVMYQEIQQKDLSATSGVFALSLNDGSVVPSTFGYSFDQIFGNYGTFALTPATCGSGAGSYMPSADDGRLFSVSFKTSTMSSWEVVATQPLNYVPMAIEAKQIAGFPATSLFRVDTGTVPGTVAALSATQASNLVSLASGSSTQYVKAGTGGATIPSFAVDPGSPVAGDIWFNSAGDQLKYYDGSTVQTVGSGSGTGTVTSIIAGTGLTGGTITTSGTIAVDVGTAANKIVQVQAGGKLPALDGSLLTNLSGSAISGNISVTNVTSSSDRTSQLQIFHGTDAITIDAPAGLVAGGYTLNLPTDKAGVAGQVLTATDTSGTLGWATPSSFGPSLADDKIWVGQTGTATPVSMSGDATISNAGLLTLKNTGLANTYYKVTTDAQGRVTSGSTSLASTDVNSFAFINGGNSFSAAASLGTNDGNALTFKTNATAAMTIDSGGNVGIGTTNPSALLSVGLGFTPLDTNELAQFGKTGNTAVDITIRGGNGSPLHFNAGVLKVASAGTTEYLDTAAKDWTGATVTSDLSLRTNGTEVMKLSSVPALVTVTGGLSATGNVGIGTTSPSFPLDIYSSTNAVASLTGADTGQNGLNFGANSSNNKWFIYQESAANGRYLGFFQNHSGVGGSLNTPMAIATSGNVGVGTTTPTSTLDVNGYVARKIYRATGNTAFSANSGNLTGRTLTITKASSSTDLLLHYSDVFGGQTSNASLGPLCQYEIQVDGASCSVPLTSIVYIFNTTGSSAVHMHPGSIDGYCTGLATGSHTLTVRVTSTNMTNCYGSYASSPWMLTAEELN